MRRGWVITTKVLYGLEQKTVNFTKNDTRLLSRWNLWRWLAEEDWKCSTAQWRLTALSRLSRFFKVVQTVFPLRSRSFLPVENYPRKRHYAQPSGWAGDPAPPKTPPYLVPFYCLRLGPDLALCASLAEQPTDFWTGWRPKRLVVCDLCKEKKRTQETAAIFASLPLIRRKTTTTKKGLHDQLWLWPWSTTSSRAKPKKWMSDIFQIMVIRSLYSFSCIWP